MKAIDLLPQPDLSDLPPKIASKLTNVEDISELAHRLEVQAAEQTGRPASLRKRQAGVLRTLIEYFGLRGKVQRAEAEIDADRAAASAALGEAQLALEQAWAVKEAVRQRLAVAQQKIAKLSKPKAGELKEADARLAAARAAFEKEMDAGTDAAQMQAARAVQKAIAERDGEARDAAAQRGPSDMVVQALQQTESKENEALQQAIEAVGEAREERQQAVARLALIECDAATNAAVCAHVRAAQAIGACARRRYPYGFDQSSFLISCGRRSIVKSNILSGMGDEGPVFLGGLSLGQMRAAAVAPDLAVLAESDSL